MLNGLYEFAKKWSENGGVYIYSDPHFDDSDCKYMDENWPTPEEQVNNINKRVHKNDTLVILGDIGNPEYLKDIKAYKVLIAGNHDKGLSNYKDYFNELYGGPLFISKKILLSHEPIDLPYIINIHGHVHNGCSFDLLSNKFNVAADNIGYKPVNLKDIINFPFIGKIPTIHEYHKPVKYV